MSFWGKDRRDEITKTRKMILRGKQNEDVRDQRQEYQWEGLSGKHT